jgi:hypothetical protein
MHYICSSPFCTEHQETTLPYSLLQNGSGKDDFFKIKMPFEQNFTKKEDR